MEALGAFGLACNIIQVISFTRETISICRTIYTSGAADDDYGYVEKAVRQYDSLCDELQKKITAAGTGTCVEDKDLLDLAKGCLKAANKLKAKTGKLVSPSAKGSALRSTYAGVAAKWNGDRLQKLEDAMNKHQSLLESRLLMKSWYVF